MKVIWNPRSYKGSMMSQATLRGCTWTPTSRAGQGIITELLRLENALRTGQLDPPVLEREAALQLCVADRLSPPRRQRAAVTGCCLPDRQITHTPTTSISDRSRVGNRCVSSRRRSATEGAAPRVAPGLDAADAVAVAGSRNNARTQRAPESLAPGGAREPCAHGR